MKRALLILGVALASVAASGLAQADYKIIRWTSGYCEIVDHARFTPFSNDYKTGRQSFRSFGEATVVRAELVSRRLCW